MTKQKISELQERRRQGVLIKTLMRDYDLSKTSVYRYLADDVQKSRADKSWKTPNE